MIKPKIAFLILEPVKIISTGADVGVGLISNAVLVVWHVTGRRFLHAPHLRCRTTRQFLHS